MRTGLLTAVLVVVAVNDSLAQRMSSGADGPWSGQVQCVLSVRAPNYQDDQTHTWRIVSGPPALNGAFRQWPAMWSVQGTGSRAVPIAGSSRAVSPRASEVLGSPSETWTTTVPDTSAPIAISENVTTGRIRIGSQHGLLTATGAITGSTSGGASQTPISGGLQEWSFPIIEDVATATTISGTRTRSVPVGVGWRQPLGVPTTETCTWHFVKTAATEAPQSSSSGATGTTATQTTLQSAGSAGTIHSVETQSTSTPTLRRDGAPSAGAIAALNAIAITVTYPNGGETVTVGTPLNITWTHLLPNDTVFTADVSYDGGLTWTSTQANSSSGTLAWTVAGRGGTRTRIRVRTLDGVTVDQSDADFTLAAASLRTITVAGFTASGLVPARTITVVGFSATGLVPPRTITVSGWNAAGP